MGERDEMYHIVAEFRSMPDDLQYAMTKTMDAILEAGKAIAFSIAALGASQELCEEFANLARLSAEQAASHAFLAVPELRD